MSGSELTAVPSTFTFETELLEPKTPQLKRLARSTLKNSDCHELPDWLLERRRR